MNQEWVSANWLRLEDALARHFVVISYGSFWPDPLGPERTFDSVDLRVRFCSGFVISVDDVWFLVTAGHVIDEILAEEEMGRVIRRPEIMHGFHKPDVPRVYTRLSRAPGFRIFSNRLDYAALALGASVRQSLEANGVLPIMVEGLSTPGEEFDLYGLLGVPVDGLAIAHADSGQTRNFTIGMTLPLLPIQPTRPSPELAERIDGFYGEILSLAGNIEGRPARLSDIAGMSGGPLFGIRQRRDRIDYRLVGVQSHWQPAERIVAACWMWRLFNALHEQIGQIREALRRAEALSQASR